MNGKSTLLRGGCLHHDNGVVGAETYCWKLADNWELVERYPYLIGDFMWTAWDYLGENGIGTWTWEEDVLYRAVRGGTLRAEIRDAEGRVKASEELVSATGKTGLWVTAEKTYTDGAYTTYYGRSLAVVRKTAEQTKLIAAAEGMETKGAVF